MLLRKMKENEFKEVYDILDKSFDHNEIRSYEGQKRLFEDREYGVLVGQDVSGILATWDFSEWRYIEHLAVKRESRNSGIGGNILDEFMKMDNTPVILEVELPGEEITDRRIAFYLRHGFKFNDFDYIQPPMEEGKATVPLRIMSWPEKIGEKEYETIKNTLYRKVYKVK